MLFPLVTAIESAVKCLMFGRRPFFWSTVMVVARWNLTRSGWGPRDEKMSTPVVENRKSPAESPSLAMVSYKTALFGTLDVETVLKEAVV